MVKLTIFNVLCKRDEKETVLSFVAVGWVGFFGGVFLFSPALPSLILPGHSGNTCS